MYFRLTLIGIVIVFVVNTDNGQDGRPGFFYIPEKSYLNDSYSVKVPNNPHSSGRKRQVYTNSI